jgi:bifunctional non-homologous end joining protein LigD
VTAGSSLREYRRKRDFRATPEPAGEVAPSSPRRLFVVQKHAARRLHYDLRLEHHGTLKSWAVPKGPSLDPGEKRLAVEVEDHPVEYGDFEGAIPAGQYGGGTVLLWDRGWWEPRGNPEHGLRRGKLRFRLRGEKLRGDWLLVRMEGQGAGANWLLRKLDDPSARAENDGGLVARRPESVASGRTLEEIARRPDKVWRSSRGASAVEVKKPAGRRASLPDFVAPALATLVEAPPTGPDWLHEVKLDGYRVLCRVADGKARLLTRRGHDWTSRLGRLGSSAAFLPAERALIDGEVVRLRRDGTTDFQALQQALGRGATAELHLIAFDLLHLDGRDLRKIPLVDRKELLRELLAAAPAEAAAVRFSDHHLGRGEELFRQACRLGAEGIISKRTHSAYRSGRHRDWLKAKCGQRQELVVVGFTDPAGARVGLGSLLLGYYDTGGELRYAGRVGTGFDRRTLGELLRHLRPLERRTPALTPPLPRGRGRAVHWVDPRLVVEVSFSEWTSAGILRHPSFLGLREDKAAEEVRREDPPTTSGDAEKGEPKAATGTGRKRRGAAPRRTGSRPGGRGDEGGDVEIEGVRLTNSERVLYPEQGITKRQLAEYYLSVAPQMVPELAHRPLTLVRCPAGHQRQCFYQKHLAEGVPPSLRPMVIEERGGRQETYVSLDSAAGLVALAQLGVLEIHPWGSRSEHLDRPDRLIFDLDPDPTVGWPAVVGAARRLRELLRRLDLESFLKLTGGKGVHLVVPIAPELPWEEAKVFSRAIAQLLVTEDPDAFTINPSKAKRSGKIFVDYLRNGFGATAVAAYSTRARSGAPVAAPIRWDELTPRLQPDRYTLRNLRRRLAALADDPWTGMAGLRQRVRPEIAEQLRRRA